MEAELINSGELARIYMPEVQPSSHFVHSFKFDEKLYPGAKNPDLDNYPVLVLKSELDDGGKFYAFLNAIEWEDNLNEQVIKAQYARRIDHDELASAVNLPSDKIYLWTAGYEELPDEKIQKIAEILRLDWEKLKYLWHEAHEKIKEN